ncbi:MAG: TlpA disulfide reductase family protein [Pseudomonadota bacterium]
MLVTFWKTSVISVAVSVLLSCLVPAPGGCGTIPQPGDTLPELRLTAPESSRDKAYLGIGNAAGFSIADIGSNLLVLEIMGVYCPQCHKQRPHINRLFNRISTSGSLAVKVKFLGIASGATPMEAAYYVKQFKVPYPILIDTNYETHKLLGEPRTPFNMVVNREGKVLFTHLGIIEDMNSFFATLKKLAGEE